MKNIYVGNLDFNVSEDELRQAFAAYGQVDTVTILKDRDTGQPRGFGFVEMANDEEAEKAINGINGTQLGSRVLNVNERTLDYGADGKEAVTRLLKMGHEAGIIPHAPRVEFV